jgi:hypothetical protein
MGVGDALRKPSMLVVLSTSVGTEASPLCWATVSSGGLAGLCKMSRFKVISSSSFCRG